MNFNEPNVSDLQYYKAVNQSKKLRLNALKSQNPQLYKIMKMKEIKENIQSRMQRGYLDSVKINLENNNELKLNGMTFKFLQKEYKNSIYITHYKRKMIPLVLIKGSEGDLVEVIDSPVLDTSFPKKKVSLFLIKDQEFEAEVTPIRRNKSLFKE